MFNDVLWIPKHMMPGLLCVTKALHRCDKMKSEASQMKLPVLPLYPSLNQEKISAHFLLHLRK